MINTSSIYYSLVRQANHWHQAATRLSQLDNLASSFAWYGIDHKMGMLLRESLRKSIDEVVSISSGLVRQLEKTRHPDELANLGRSLRTLRNKYLKSEESIHFYTIAVNSRTTPGIAALLRACDILCVRSMQELLQPLGKQTPFILTYVDKGLGASILKAGLRLWDGRISPIAAVKITQHNLYRPTAIIHETGHQVAHMINWNDELATALRTDLRNHSKIVGEAFAGWASEMSADAFAFVHTGYGSVAALTDVLCGIPQAVFTYHQHDPHPISYLRVLMNIEMCRQFYGPGPWNELEESFKNDYDINLVDFPSVELIKSCMPALPDVVRLILRKEYRALAGKSLAQIINPLRVSPKELEKLESLAGPALFTSHAWISKECIRLLALNSYRIGVGKGDLAALYKLQEEWMTRLGFTVELN